MSDAERVIDAMRSGEWLRTQWIARVAFGLGSARQGRTLRRLAAIGRVEQRDVEEQREGEIGQVPVRPAIPRQEWTLTR